MSGCLLYSLHWPLTNHIWTGASSRSNRIRYVKGCLFPGVYTSLVIKGCRAPSSGVDGSAGKRSLAAKYVRSPESLLESHLPSSNEIFRMFGDVTDGTAAVVCVIL